MRRLLTTATLRTTNHHLVSSTTATTSLLNRRLRLDPQVALRPEPFGALAYHYGNRKLIFLKHPDVVRVVQALADHDTLADTLRACEIDPARWPAFERAAAPPSTTRRCSMRSTKTHLVEQLKTGSMPRSVSRGSSPTPATSSACTACRRPDAATPASSTTDEAKAVLDELHDLQVFYINIGGGEPMIRRDFFELLEYSIGRGIGVKFSTNGAFIDADKAHRLAEMDYLDIQISLDGTDAVTNDAVRGEGSYDTAIGAMNHLRDAGFGEFKISVVVTRHNVDQLDEFKALADSFGAQLRITRLRPSGRGADSWHDLHPTNAQQRRDLRVVARPRRQRADRRLVLPPQRARRRTTARAQHVRRRPRRVPDRPDRRRLRLPVRDPRRVQGRLGP